MALLIASSPRFSQAACDGLALQIIEVEVRTTGEQKLVRFVASDAIHPALRREMGLTGGLSTPSPWLSKDDDDAHACLRYSEDAHHLW